MAACWRSIGALDAATAEEVAKLFVECIVAPGYDAAALEKFAAKKNLRLLEMPREAAPEELELKRISGGVLVQEADRHELSASELKMVTDRAPTDAEMRALLFAWKVSKHVKSNAIVFAREGQTAGIGAGQMSRVDSVKIAVMKAETAGFLWGNRGGFRRVLSVPGRRGRSGERGSDGGDSAGRLGSRWRRDRRGEQAGDGDGVYRVRHFRH